VIPLHGDGVNPVPEDLKGSPPEPIVWTFEEATGKNIVEGEDPGPQPIADAINQCLSQAGTRKSVIFADDNEFASAILQPHRKGEKAYHVKAHRGSKEGMSTTFPGGLSLIMLQAIYSSLLLAYSTASRSPLLSLTSHP
jgi:hypothetical protein